MSSKLMISVAGVRGIVGETLTPEVATRFAAAFAAVMPPGRVVIGRDARTSGPMMLRAVSAGLMGMGRDVIDIGLATTPTTELAVDHLEAAGGIILTASHNPAPWNALKFLSGRGEFLGPEQGAAVRERYEAGEPDWHRFDALGSARSESKALDWHLDCVMGLSVLDVGAIRARGLKIAVDGCRSVGGVAVPRLLAEMGVEAVELDCEPDGRFTRELEPSPETLGALGKTVKDSGADFGVALDPDGDRAAFVDGDGRPLGEEYTVALGTRVVIGRKPGSVVTNLSTSNIVEAVCREAGVELHRSPVGEAHVVAKMREVSAVAGGEGNGGMILPEAHYGRDGLVAVALMAQAVVSSGRSLRELADQLPRYTMVKEKIARPDNPWEEAAGRLRRHFRDHAVDTADGLRFSRDEEWLHVRPSGTEPVVRLIAESPSEPRTRTLIEEARKVVQATG